MTTKQEIENKNKAIENSEEIVFTIKFCKEELQSFAENNFGRELTDVELNRISECWDDMEKVCDVRDELIIEVIEGSMDNKDNYWSDVDEDYIKALKK